MSVVKIIVRVLRRHWQAGTLTSHARGARDTRGCRSQPVSRVLSAAAHNGLSGAVIYLGCMSPCTSSDLPGSPRGPRVATPHGGLAPLFGLAPGGVYPATGVSRRGALLPHLFTLAAPTGRTVTGCPPGVGGLFSVALSVSSHSPGVTWHPALGARTFLCIASTQRLPG